MATNKQKEAARRNIGKARQAQSARASPSAEAIVRPSWYRSMTRGSI